MKDRYLLKCVAITYEEPDELLTKGKTSRWRT